MAVSLKFLSNFCRTLELPLVNCKINLILTWPWICVTAEVNRYKKLYVTFVTLSTNDNVTLLDQLKSGFKRTINWSRYQSKIKIQQQNPHLHYLIDLSFQAVNRLFVLSFPDNRISTGDTIFYPICGNKRLRLWFMDKK